MMSSILAIINAITPIINRIIPDPDKRLDIQRQLEDALISAKAQIFTSMKDVMVADAQSDSSYTKNARPTIVYWSLGIVSLIVLVTPFGYSDVILTSLNEVPSKMWDLMTVGVGAFVLGRSGEKMLNNYKEKN